MIYQGHIPLGVQLVDSSTFLLQCQLCGQQWEPQVAPGGMIARRSKLCLYGCTQKLAALKDHANEYDFTLHLQDGSFFFEGGYTGATASFPLTRAGVDAAFEWVSSQAEESYEEESIE